MKVLYIGQTASESISRHSGDALTRLGHEVMVIPPLKFTSLEVEFSPIRPEEVLHEDVPNQR